MRLPCTLVVVLALGIGAAWNPASGAVRLAWHAPRPGLTGYHVYRGKPGAADLVQLTKAPVRQTVYADATAETGVAYTYAVRSVSPRGIESGPTPPVTATATLVNEPVFAVEIDKEIRGTLHGGRTLAAKLHGSARPADGEIDLRQNGHVSFPHDERFDLGQPRSIECRVWFDEPGTMPVVLRCGLCVGQYSAQPGPPYQVCGRIAGVKLYHRAVQP